MLTNDPPHLRQRKGAHIQNFTACSDEARANRINSTSQHRSANERHAKRVLRTTFGRPAIEFDPVELAQGCVQLAVENQFQQAGRLCYGTTLQHERDGGREGWENNVNQENEGERRREEKRGE